MKGHDHKTSVNEMKTASIMYCTYGYSYTLRVLRHYYFLQEVGRGVCDYTNYNVPLLPITYLYIIFMTHSLEERTVTARWKKNVCHQEV